MGKFERNSNNSKGSGGGRGGGGKGKGDRNHHKAKGDKVRHPKDRKPSNFPKKHKKVVVSFNPTDRHEYLTGFSTRKKDRRAFGLAMQKVKDREAKLEERKESRQAQLEKIEDIERNKVALRKGISGDNDDDAAAASDDDGSVQKHHKPQHNEQEMKTFQDEQTTNQFGGQVRVTTTFGIPSDDDDDDDDDLKASKKEFYARKTHGAGHVDEAQTRAGNVNNYISTVKSSLGSKKRGASGGGGGKNKKGQHGASTMKGMGNGATLKAAQKTLSKFKARGGKGGDERGGGKGKTPGKKRKARK
ncbi:hypothetical protein ACHAXR_012590 [Thalassiosira sp. AJA248-18]